MRHRKVQKQKYDGQDWSNTGLHLQSWWLFVRFKYIFATLGACVIRKYIKYIEMTGDSTSQAKDCLWTLSAWLSQSLSIDCGSENCSVLFSIFLIYHLEIACELWVFDQVCPACLPVRSLKEMEVQFNSKTWIGSFNFNFHFSDQIYVESLTWTIQIEVETQHQFHFFVSVA